MKDWVNFFTAIVGAVATLTGLIFVGVSISLNKILQLPQLPNRAIGALVILMNVLICAVICIVPSQSALVLGLELLSLCIAAWIITFTLDIKMLKLAEPALKTNYWINLALNQLTLIPGFISGVLLIGSGFKALYWLVPFIVFSIIKAVIDAWVLLIEVHR